MRGGQGWKKASGQRVKVVEESKMCGRPWRRAERGARGGDADAEWGEGGALVGTGGEVCEGGGGLRAAPVMKEARKTV